MVNRKLPTIFICVIFSFLFYSFAAAVTTLYSSGDSYITGDSHNNENNGSSPNLRLKHPPGFSHILVRFSQSGISSAVGSGTLVSAKLRMYIETNFNNWGSGTNVDVHRITQDWTELGVTWNCPIDTDLGNTNPNCSTQWAGGTYVTPQTNTVFQANTTGWAEWDVTADVQAFLSGTSNYGWLIRKRSSSASGSLDYTSREGNALYTPRLVVTVNNGPPIVTCTPTPGPNQA